MAKKGIISHHLCLHIGFTTAHDGATIHIMGIQQIPGIYLDILPFPRIFSDFLSFSIQHRLVNLCCTLYQHAICRQLVTSLEKDNISHYHIIHRNLCQAAIADNLGEILGTFILPQSYSLALLLVFANSSHTIGQQDSDKHTYSLIPLCLSQQVQHCLD